MSPKSTAPGTMATEPTSIPGEYALQATVPLDG